MAIKRSNRGGASPLAYVGVSPVSTPAFFEVSRAPTTRDYAGYFLGDVWLDRKTNDVWILVSLEKNIATGAKEATWVEFGSGDAILRSFITDSGKATSAAGGMNVFGFQGFNTLGSGDTITVQMDSTALDGQIWIGGGIAHALGYITSTGGTVAITNGPNSITITSVPNGDLERLETDSGTATPVGGTIDIAGTTNITTSAVGAVVTVSLNNDISLTNGLTISSLSDGVMQTTGAGVVTSTKGTDGQMLIGSTAGAPAWNNITSTGGTISVNNVASGIELEVGATGTLQTLGSDSGTCATITGTVNVLGGDNINTTGAGSTVTANLDNSITLAGGLTLSASGSGVLQNSGAGVVSSSNGTNGQFLIGATGAAPAWADVTSSTLDITAGAGTLQIEKNSSTSPCPPFMYVLENDSGLGTLGGTSWFYLGDDVVLSQVFDDGSNFYPGDGAGAHAYFEAPVTGKYLINFTALLKSSSVVGSIAPGVWIEIECPSRSFYHGYNIVMSPSLSLLHSRSFSAICDLTASDKVYFKVRINSGVASYISGDSIITNPAETWISGLLIEV